MSMLICVVLSDQEEYIEAGHREETGPVVVWTVFKKFF